MEFPSQGILAAFQPFHSWLGFLVQATRLSNLKLANNVLITLANGILSTSSVHNSSQHRSAHYWKCWMRAKLLVPCWNLISSKGNKVLVSCWNIIIKGNSIFPAMWLADTGDMLIGVDYSIPLSFDVFNVYVYSKVLYHVLEALLPVAYLGVYPTAWAGQVFMVTENEILISHEVLYLVREFVQGQWKVWKFYLDVANYFRCFHIDEAILFLKLSEPSSVFLLIHGHHHAWFMKTALPSGQLQALFLFQCEATLLAQDFSLLVLFDWFYFNVWKGIKRLVW